MPKNHRRFLLLDWSANFFRAALILVTLIGFPVVAKTSVTFCAETRPYPPYVYIDEQGKAAGILIDIINKSASQSGFKANFITHPWLKCQKLVEDNEAQALFGMIKTPERETTFQFPKSTEQYIAAAEYPVFYAKASVFNNHYDAIFTPEQFNAETYRDIKRFGLQAPLGYVVQKLLTNYELAADINYTVDEGLEMAARNRLDGYIVERTIGLSRLKTLQLEDKLLVSDTPITKDYWYVPFNKQFYQQNQALVDKFWQVMASVRGK